MDLRGKITTTFAVQLIGIFATIVAPMIIARKYGPEAQGYLEFFRSFANTTFTFALFGVPQAFTYFINRRIFDSQIAILWSVIQFLVCSAVLGLILYSAYFLNTDGWQGYGKYAFICFGIAVPFLVIHHLLRSIVLATRNAFVFSLTTIITPVLLCATYAIWPEGDYKSLTTAVVVSGSGSALLALVFLRKHCNLRLNELAKLGPYVSRIFAYSRWSYVQNLALMAIPFIVYSILRDRGISYGMVGNFSISVLAVGMLVTPLTVIVPILFDDWSKLDDRDQLRAAYSQLASSGLILGSLAIVIGLMFVKPITILLFGPDFLPSAQSTSIMLGSVYALFLSRLLSAALLALGSPNIIAFGAIVKLLVTITPLFFIGQLSLAAVAICWVGGEYMGTLALGAYLHFRFKWPINDISGFSTKLFR